MHELLHTRSATQSQEEASPLWQLGSSPQDVGGADAVAHDVAAIALAPMLSALPTSAHGADMFEAGRRAQRAASSFSVTLYRLPYLYGTS